MAWQHTCLGRICTIRGELIDPSIAKGFRYIGLEHIDTGNSFLRRYGQSEDVKSTKNKFYTGDVLYRKLRPYLDKAVLADWNGICSTDILVLKSVKEISPEYLANLLHTKSFVGYAIKTTSGVNHPRTSWQSLKEFPLELPPLPEQRVIAHVLTIVRQAIEATERVIEATHQVKKSMMKHLFTYGPVPIDQVDRAQLKETKIGLAPEHWKVVRVEDVVEKTRQVDPTKIPDRPFKYIDVSSVDNQRLRIIGSQELKGKDAPNRARKPIKSGDVIFATVRPYLKRVASVPPDLDGQICSTAFCVLRPTTNLVAPFYLFFAVSDDRFVLSVAENQRGSSYPAVSDGEVLNKFIFIPPLFEQVEIVRILQSLDGKLETEESRKKALEDLFKTLIYHLMTGKVRVGHLDQQKV